MTLETMPIEPTSRPDRPATLLHLALALGVLLGAASCRKAPPPRPAPAPTPVVALPVPDTVWTRDPAVVLRMDSGGVALPRAFTRLEVLRGDSASLLVRCTVCAAAVTGWVSRAEVVHAPSPPSAAAAGSVAEFALSIRAAAAGHDLVELRPAMADDFSFSAIGTFGRDLALNAWLSEEFQTLDRVPALLDGGLTPLGEWWVAPVDYASRLDYRGLRLGFKKTGNGRWEWAFLMRGEVE